MVLVTRDNGTRTNSMEKESRSGLMVPSTKVTISKDRKRALELSIGPTGQNIMASS